MKFNVFEKFILASQVDWHQQFRLECYGENAHSAVPNSGGFRVTNLKSYIHRHRSIYVGQVFADILVFGFFPVPVPESVIACKVDMFAVNID